MQMAWTAAFAVALLIGWLVESRRRRGRLGPLAADGRRGRLGLGVVLGILGYGFVAAPLLFLANELIYAGRPSF
jgi:hypothetical protein